jgi:hypothetical protein
MPKELTPDFVDLLRSLKSHRVDFIVVGAYALAFHGVARYTADLDLWMRTSEDNAARLKLALNEFGSSISDDEARGMAYGRKLLRLGHEPNRVEILNFLDGCEYDQASGRALTEHVGTLDVPILSLEDYVATKKAVGRAKDASDLILLREKIGPLPGD